jgi:putative restriction endonuclease
MKYWFGVTDTNWYHFLRERKPEDINFWQPSGNHQQFRAIDKGAPFLFKLKAPINAIGGVGFFSAQAFLPISIAWDAFAERNGCSSYFELKRGREIGYWSLAYTQARSSWMIWRAKTKNLDGSSCSCRHK